MISADKCHDQLWCRFRRGHHQVMFTFRLSLVAASLQLSADSFSPPSPLPFPAYWQGSAIQYVCFFVMSEKLIRTSGKSFNALVNIQSRIGVTVDGGLDWMVGFIDTLYRQLGTTGNYSATAVSTHFTVHRYKRTSVLSLHLSLSLQRIYNSITVTSHHAWSLLVTV
jgi:hypothetical protein